MSRPVFTPRGFLQPLDFSSVTTRRFFRCRLVPVYEYKALDAKGKSAQGVVDADTPRDAREKLRFQKIYVTDIVEVRGTAGKRQVVKDASGEKRVVVSTALPKVMQYCAVLAFAAAGIEVIQLLMAWSAKDRWSSSARPGG